ncbi:MAG: DUF1844 domain-containing protein [Candidatus Aminicenantes bacterium]|nr:DUF1844 domain-containing protein [Candidatus Aminicenantes bacterium]RLE03215.1 MAG: DUF1844 domain-containing protein [Candidatus Aminicenantes bacterium]RLE04145.1 MAG: DUF1844 domain-containing protein [Candidatus Aminicenantes bacterium]
MKEVERPTKNEQSQEIIPPLDFSSLVLPFYTQALIKLGETKDPITNQTAPNLELAKRLIDLLDLLKQRTQGNLQPEEEKFLNNCLHQLRLSYLEKVKAIKL